MLYRETGYRRLKRAGTLANGLELLVSSVDQFKNLVEAQKRNLQSMNHKRATAFGVRIDRHPFPRSNTPSPHAIEITPACELYLRVRQHTRSAVPTSS